MSIYSSSSVNGYERFDDTEAVDTLLTLASAPKMLSAPPMTSRKRPAPRDDEPLPQYELLVSSGAGSSSSSVAPFSYDQDRFLMPYDKQHALEPTGNLYTVLSAPSQPQHQSRDDFDFNFDTIPNDYFLTSLDGPPGTTPIVIPSSSIYKYRPDTAITPPMTQTSHQGFQGFTTPADAGAPLVGSSLMYTPPEDQSPNQNQQNQNLPTNPYGGYSFLQTTAPPKVTTSRPPAQKMIMDPSQISLSTSTEHSRTNSIVHIEPASRGIQKMGAPLIVRESDIYGNSNIIMPTFSHDHVNGDGDVEIRRVDGRLPSVNCSSKYILTVGELRRRTSYPESMNKSQMYSFFRKSKKKEQCDAVREVFYRHKIEIPEMQRSRKSTRFTPMLEGECIRLATDFRISFERDMPIDPIAKNMVLNMILRGVPTDQCIKKLQSTVKILDHIITTLSVRQPTVSNHQPALKNNRLDVAYHVFSLLTHGFGHPISLLHYKSYLKIAREAVCYAELLNSGYPLDQDGLTPDQAPFKLWPSVPSQY